jgi:acetyltransferase-like isoleucine patch superfamily enzyme
MRSLKPAKTAARLVALISVMPLLLMYWSAARLRGCEKVFPGFSQLLSLVPGLTGVYVRQAFYRMALPQCDVDACISFGTVISHSTACIGKTVYVGVFCALGDVTLEDDVLVASHVSIANGGKQHGTSRLDVPVREQPGEWPRITIGRDTWIGDRAVVLADVGRHCVIGAGAVVTKPIPDYAIAIGCPARVVGDRRHQAQPEATEVSTPRRVHSAPSPSGRGLG